MDIYSSKKKARHGRPSKKAPKGGKNIFTRIKEWFLSMSTGKRTAVVVLTSIILVLVIALGIIMGVVMDMLKDYNHNDDVDKDEEIQQIVPISEGIVNIALFGIDSRSVSGKASFKGLSDSIMILSLNTDTGKINIISVMRDSLVEIPGKAVNKINSAYSMGGATLAIKTLNHNFGLDIKEYATVNFYGMAEIIDAVGGVEIDVQKQEINGYRRLNDLITELAGYMGVKAELVKGPGLQTLNGIQAVSWARIRAASTATGEANDYGRTDRQRYVMEQLLNKALATSISEYPKLIKALLPYMETSLSYDEIFKLAGILAKDVTFEQTRIPQHSYTLTPPRINRVGSSVYYNLDFAEDIIHALIYDGVSQDDYIKSNGVVKSGWYKGPTDSAKPSSSIGSDDTDSDITDDPDGSSDDESSSDTLGDDESSDDSTTTSSSGSDDEDESDDTTGDESQESSSQVSTSQGSSSDAGTSVPPPTGSDPDDEL